MPIFWLNLEFGPEWAAVSAATRAAVSELPLTALREFNTSRGKWSAEQVEDSGEQLLLYSHLASEISPGKKIVTRFLGDHPARPFGNRRARADGRNERVAVDISL